MSHRRFPALLVLAAFSSPGGLLRAGDLYSGKQPAKPEDSALPKASDIRALTIHPNRVVLKGMDDAQQLVLTAESRTGLLQDLTGDVKYEVADKKVARITSTG